MDRLTLLPCPFCGGEAELRKRYSALEGEPKHYVRCSSGKCGARYVPDGFPVDEWNRRQPLSQEAVREEALEVPLKPDIGWLRKVAALCPNLDGTEDMVGVVRGVHGAILATALKREPNAAGQTPLSVRTGSDAEVDSRQVESATSACAKPAPAAPNVGGCHVCSGPALKFGTGCALTNCPYRTAPDVASMVKRLRDCCAMIGYATSGAERASHKRNADAAEAALLAKLGQGAPLSTDYIQTVPDKCDRIIWRGRYYHLPLAPGASDG